MKISDNGLAVIKKFEGLRLESYMCPSSVATVGYGHTHGVKLGMTITEEQADEFLKHDVESFEQCVSTYTNVKVNQNEFDALVSFAFNVGCGAYKDSTLRRLLNEGQDKKVVAEQFGRWVKGADGQPLPGLVTRRQAEKDLFLEKIKHPKLGQSIYAKQDTYLKKRMADSSSLLPEEKVFVPKGSAWEWNELTMFAGKTHQRVRLTADQKNWYIWGEHWKVINDVPPGAVTQNKGSGIDLDVKYYSQRDNYRDSDRTCYSSSCAMLLNYLKPGIISNDDDYIKTVFSIGDTTEAWVQVKALSSYGVEAEFRQDMGWEDVENLLRNSIPCPLGILHRGLLDSPSGSGHWILAKGISPDGKNIICHDPFGSLDLDTGVYLSANGANQLYNKEKLGKRWTISSAHDGWGIVAEHP